ncbi:MAG: hypothetical protein IKI82_04000 [Lachnospiraceae bacterium]|nr:hypothetical protein [Lachnospiraceae bacterium]
MIRRVPNKRPKYIWWTGLLSVMVVGALVAVYGITRWIVSGFKSTNALICAAAGIVIFFVFRWVKSLDKEYEEEDPERKDGGAP